MQGPHRGQIGPTRGVMHDGGRVLVKTDPTALAEHIISIAFQPFKARADGTEREKENPRTFYLRTDHRHGGTDIS